jgi:hydroxymethylglutaryl-CoA synthase
VTDRIEEVREKAPKVEDFLLSKRYLDYAAYAKHQGKIKM